MFIKCIDELIEYQFNTHNKQKTLINVYIKMKLEGNSELT